MLQALVFQALPATICLVSAMTTTSESLRERIGLYERLMRLDKPIGTLLLLWPTLWAVWIGGDCAPHVVVYYPPSRVALRRVHRSSRAILARAEVEGWGLQPVSPKHLRFLQARRRVRRQAPRVCSQYRNRRVGAATDRGASRPKRSAGSRERFQSCCGPHVTGFLRRVGRKVNRYLPPCAASASP